MCNLITTLINIIVLTTFLLNISNCASGPASWSHGGKIWAGEALTINKSLVSPGGPYNKTQPYTGGLNFTFSSLPRVVLGLQGYNQYSAGSPTTLMGFSVNITTVGTTSFDYVYHVYGAQIFLLFYNYFVIDTTMSEFQVTYTHKIFTTENITNTSLIPRIHSYVANNNPGQVYDLTHQIIMLAYVAGFKYQPGTTGINIMVTIQPLNSTTHTVTITTGGDCSLNEVTFFRLSFDRTTVEDGYTTVIALYNLEGINSTQQYYAYNFPFFFYRSLVFGWYRIEVPTNQSPYFVYNLTNTSFLTTVNTTYHRLVSNNFMRANRVCPNISLTFYYHPDYQCYDVCPSGYYGNTTKSYCQKCHYSCLACNGLTLSNCISCNSNHSRALPVNQSSGTCSCSISKYDSGVSICSQCHISCYTCSASSTNCTSCNGTNRTLINNTCQCVDTFYDSNNTCVACSLGCKICTNASLCTVCTSGLNRQINNSTSSCTCISGFGENNGSATCVSCQYPCLTCSSSKSVCVTCLYPNTLELRNNSCKCINGKPDLGNGDCSNVCGNGILQTGETCDDQNTQSGDGCSSTCLIEANHKCVTNFTLTNVTKSVCYYSQMINFNMVSVYKQPFDNLVEIEFIINAININKYLLTKYLQSSVKRLLQNSLQTISLSIQPTSIQKISYNSDSDYLVVNARYYADVDFNGALIVLSPSNSISLYSYFYQTPVTETVLSSPYNNLPTKYIENSQLNATKAIYYVYLVLVIIFYLFILFALWFRMIPIAIQSLYVVNIAYYGLLALKQINNSMVGLGYWGKYFNGFNIRLYSQSINCDNALSINFSCTLINNLNITFWLGSICCLIYFTLTIYIYRRIPIEVKDQTQQLPSFLLKARTVSQEIYYLIGFIIIQGFIVSLVFQTSQLLIISLIQSIFMAIYFILMWVNWFFLRKTSKKVLKSDFSLFKILKLNKKSFNIFYPILFICFIFNGIILAKVGGYAAYTLIMVFSICKIIMFLKVTIYRNQFNKVRQIINQISIITICLVYLVNYTLNTTTGIASSVIILLILFINFGLNIGFTFWISVYLSDKKEEEEEESVKNSQTSSIKNNLQKPEITNLRPLIQVSQVEELKVGEQNWKLKIQNHTLSLRQVKKNLTVQLSRETPSSNDNTLLNPQYTLSLVNVSDVEESIGIKDI